MPTIFSQPRHNLPNHVSVFPLVFHTQEALALVKNKVSDILKAEEYDTSRNCEPFCRKQFVLHLMSLSDHAVIVVLE